MLIERIVPRAVSGDVSTALQRMAASGANREGLVAAIELLAAARAQQPSIDEVIELVTTGPEAGAVTNRDTQVVVLEMPRTAFSSPGMSCIRRSRCFALWLTEWPTHLDQPYKCS